ncbi:MAG: tRNA (guanine(10)-N(2))-dimethyltransferase [Candidatus Bathyarchaeia archaeon]
MLRNNRNVILESFKPNFPTQIIEEGRVKVLVPELKAFVKLPSDYAPSKAPVFYNPVMEFNRDLAVLALQAYQRKIERKISVCEPLTGCGLRGIRFAVEVEGVGKTVLNDINEQAFRLASYNVQMNGLANCITVTKKEANFVLSSYSAPHMRFDFIDIDPFGSPVPFLDSAVRALRDGGLLALTATDMASLCGIHPRACMRKYGGNPLRTEYCHELAARLIAGCLTTVAAKHDLGVNVVFTHRGEHYARVYATVKYGAKSADESMGNMGFVLHCFKCFHRETKKGLFEVDHSRECRECGSRLRAAGPLWLGKLFDTGFCDMMEQESRKRRLRFGVKIAKTLSLIKSESSAPFTYFVIDKMCDVLNLPVPPVKVVIEALRKEGFQASSTHFSSRGVRSEVSAGRLTEMLRGLTKTAASDARQ